MGAVRWSDVAGLGQYQSAFPLVTTNPTGRTTGEGTAARGHQTRLAQHPGADHSFGRQNPDGTWNYTYYNADGTPWVDPRMPTKALTDAAAERERRQREKEAFSGEGSWNPLATIGNVVTGVMDTTFSPTATASNVGRNVSSAPSGLVRDVFGQGPAPAPQPVRPAPPKPRQAPRAAAAPRRAPPPPPPPRKPPAPPARRLTSQPGRSEFVRVDREKERLDAEYEEQRIWREQQKAWLATLGLQNATADLTRALRSSVTTPAPVEDIFADVAASSAPTQQVRPAPAPAPLSLTTVTPPPPVSYATTPVVTLGPSSVSYLPPRPLSQQATQAQQYRMATPGPIQANMLAMQSQRGLSGLLEELPTWATVLLGAAVGMTVVGLATRRIS